MRARVCLGFRVSTAVGPGPHWDKHWKREVASGVRGFALDRMDRGNDSASCCNPAGESYKEADVQDFFPAKDYFQRRHQCLRHRP